MKNILPELTRPELVKCRSCNGYTLPGIAQVRWPQGFCTLCQDPQEGAAVRRKLEMASDGRMRQVVTRDA